MPNYDYKCINCGVVEIFHSIMDDAWNICPECKQKGLEKMISAGGAVIVAGREANQYNDILKAKYWRDKNGVRHKVQSGDGHTGAGTVQKQTVSPEIIAARKKQDALKDKARRSASQGSLENRRLLQDRG